MKKTVIRSLVLAAAGMSLTAGSAMAYSIHIEDTMKIFPGEGGLTHNYDSSMVGLLADSYGVPHISGMDIQINDTTNALEKVSVSMTNWIEYDSLFINTNWNGAKDDWHSWEYFVRYDDAGKIYPNQNGSIATGIYSVAADYQYSLAGSSGRAFHPEGIGSGLSGGVGFETGFYTVDASGVTYDFTKLSQSIILGNNFSLAYVPWCANDVIGKVPEPANMLLFGTGLVGLAVAGRKKRANKK